MMASASPVFFCMFNGPMAEQDAVKLPDIDADIFNDILKFVYTDDIEIDVNNVSGMLYCSDKYMLHDVKEKCNQYLTSLVDDEHACVVLQIAYDYHLEDRQKAALHYIFQNGYSCLHSDTFLFLSSECLKLIIESDDLKCNEEDVYLRTLDWAKHKCQEKKLTITDKEIRSVLGDLFYLIRFPIIKRKFFTKNIASRELLTSKETIGIFCSYDDEPVGTFSSNPRQPDTIEVRRCELYKNAGWNHMGQSDCIDFKTNKNCYIAGILVFGSKSCGGHHNINLELLQSSLVLNSTKQTLYSESGNEIYQIYFENPIRILRNTRYTIRLIMKGPEAFTGKNYKTEILAPELSVTILPPSEVSDNCTLESSGQIPGVILRI